jgi:hypothetical protein
VKISTHSIYPATWGLHPLYRFRAVGSTRLEWYGFSLFLGPLQIAVALK